MLTTIKKIKIATTSLNPVKIEATKLGFSKMQGLLNKMYDQQVEFEVIGISVPSGVDDQPQTSQETLQGAINRTQAGIELNSKESLELDFIVSQEGGIEHFDQIEDSYTESFAWVMAYDTKRQKYGKSRTASITLPPKVVQLLHQGYELGTADDMVFAQSNSKQGMGGVGLLTAGAITRENFYAEAVSLALIPVLQTDLY